MALVTDRQKCAHLLRRFGLGASEGEIDYYLASGGIEGAVDRLLNYDSVNEGFNIDLTSLTPPGKNAVPVQVVTPWWITRLVQTRRPLQERMTVFWHNHFATSAEKVKNAITMYDQNETMRRNALGNFRTMLLEISKDPAMIFWLDNQFNVKGKANENFAREVMELFTLGIGNYSEHDIQESARAFTGYSIGRGVSNAGQLRKGGLGATFLFRPNLHDDGEKTFFNKTGAFNGDDIINMLCDNPRMSQFITEKMWRILVYPNPEPEVVAKYSTYFREANLEIKPLVRSIMLSPEFYSPKAERAIYKSPVDFVISTSRQLGLGAFLPTGENAVGRLRQVNAMSLSMKGMGMQLCWPPDVSGWDHGAAWVSTATMVERITWANMLFGGQGKQPVVPVQVAGLFTQDPSPDGVARKLCSIFDAPLPNEKVNKVADAIQKEVGGSIDERTANKAAAAGSRLIFASPEFQFC